MALAWCHDREHFAVWANFVAGPLWLSSVPQAIFPVASADAECVVDDEMVVFILHTPNDSSESDVRQLVVSQHLCKACPPDVQVAMYRPRAYSC